MGLIRLFVWGEPDKRNHGKIVPDYSTFGKRNDSKDCDPVFVLDSISRLIYVHMIQTISITHTNRRDEVAAA
jgi:hypothetical protein